MYQWFGMVAFQMSASKNDLTSVALNSTTRGELRERVTMKVACSSVRSTKLVLWLAPVEFLDDTS